MGRLTEMFDLVTNGPTSKNRPNYTGIGPSSKDLADSKVVRKEHKKGVPRKPKTEKVEEIGLTCKIDYNEFKNRLAAAGPAPVSIPDKAARDKWLSERGK